MQAVILAAGKNSRFFPLNTITHKALFKLYGKPILEYLINDLKEVGVNEIILVLGTFDYVDEVKDYFKDGSQFGVKLSYATQTEPLGQSNAILSARDLITDDFMVLNPYQIGAKSIFKAMIDKFYSKNLDGLISAKETKNIEQYGAFTLDGEKILDYIEKPKREEAPSNIRKTSIEIYKNNFLEVLAKYDSLGGEYPNIDAMLSLARSGNVEIYDVGSEYIPSLKLSFDLLGMREWFFENKQTFIDPSSIVFSNNLKGVNYIGKNTQIGESTIIENCEIGDGVKIGYNTQLINSIIMDGVNIGDNCQIENTIIGTNCQIGDDVKFAAFDNGRDIKVEIKGEVINSGLKELGSLLGKNVKVGNKSKFAPGILIGMSNEIPESAQVKSNLNHND